MANKHTISDLYQMQSLPLQAKIQMTRRRISEWVDTFGEDGIYVSFSGGKDSTVLLDIVRKDYPDVKAVFVDTGLEYPEIRSFVKGFNNVDRIKPKITFKQVIEKYGYPFISKDVSNCVDGARKYLRILTDRQTDRQTIPYACYIADMLGIDRRINKQNPSYLQLKKGNIPSCNQGSEYRLRRLEGELLDRNGNKSQFNQERYKFFLKAPFEISDKCCNVMKKTPTDEYSRLTGRKAILATMASESKLRTIKWLQEGCNAFDAVKPKSKPMSFWTEQDVLLYIYENKLPIASVYGDVVIDYEAMGQVEGQMDMSQLASEFGVFDVGRPILKTTGVNRTGCMFCGYGCHLEKSPNRFERMKETHPKQYNYIMKPVSDGGLGYKEIIDWINEHGNMNIKY